MRLPDGEGTEIASNIVSEYSFNMCDTYGNNNLLFRDILDNKYDDIAVSQTYELIRHPNTIPNYRNTTKGRKIQIEWYARTMTRE